MTTTPATRDEREVKRYRIELNGWNQQFITTDIPSGEYVSAADYALAESELAEVREQVEQCKTLEAKLEAADDRAFRASEAHVVTMQKLVDVQQENSDIRAQAGGMQMEIDELRAELERVKASEAAAHKEVIRYHWLRKQTPYRFKKIQDESLIDGGDVVYFHSGNFTAAIDAARGVEG